MKGYYYDNPFYVSWHIYLALMQALAKTLVIPIFKLNNKLILSGLLALALNLLSPCYTAIAQQLPVYPRVTGYFSITNALETYTKDGFTGNFGKIYTVSFPFGMNLLKSDHFGVSFEISPTIRTENNLSKVSSVTFHPGAMFRYSHGFTFIARAAFETNGRFGFTPVFNKVVVRLKDASFFASVPFPVRFGNGLPTSVGAGLQLGVSF